MCPPSQDKPGNCALHRIQFLPWGSVVLWPSWMKSASKRSRSLNLLHQCFFSPDSLSFLWFGALPPQRSSCHPEMAAFCFERPRRFFTSECIHLVFCSP